MKKRLCFLVLFTSIFSGSLVAQLEYSINLGCSGGHFHESGKSFLTQPQIGLFGGFGFKYIFSERMELDTELQLHYLSLRTKTDLFFVEEFEAPAFYIYGSSAMYAANLISEICTEISTIITIGAGLNTSIILNQKHNESSQPIKIPSDNKFSPLTFGLNGKVKLDIKSFYIQVRYLFGLTNAGNFYIYDYREKSKTIIKSRVLQFGIGYTFNSKSKSTTKKRR